MAEQQRRSIEVAIVEACRASPEGADLLVSAFVHALRSYHRASVCTPFPSAFLSNVKEKDFTSVQQAIQQFPRIEDLLLDAEMPGALQRLPLQALSLLCWLLRFRHHLELVRNPPEELFDVLPKESSPWRMRGSEYGMTKCVLPNCVVKVRHVCCVECFKLGLYDLQQVEEAEDSSEFARIKSQFGSLVAFHGTAVENLHSILRCGLLSFSNTEMQKNGSMYGDGIYFSTDPLVALGFSSPGNGWTNSCFGDRLRCILLCEIANGDGVLCSDKVSISKRVAAADGTARTYRNDLGTYVVVRSNNLVKVRYIFLYSESSNPASSIKAAPRASTRLDGQATTSWLLRLNWCKVAIVLYCVLLIGIGLLSSNRNVKRKKVPISLKS